VKTFSRERSGKKKVVERKEKRKTLRAKEGKEKRKRKRKASVLLLPF
jgi:hypothetical protein